MGARSNSPCQETPGPVRVHYAIGAAGTRNGEADEPVGEPIPSLEEGVPTQDRVTVDDRGMVGLPRGVGGEKIHGHTIVRSGSTGR
jgi:hypothetical protein